MLACNNYVDGIADRIVMEKKTAGIIAHYQYDLYRSVQNANQLYTNGGWDEKFEISSEEEECCGGLGTWGESYENHCYNIDSCVNFMIRPSLFSCWLSQGLHERKKRDQHEKCGCEPRPPAMMCSRMFDWFAFFAAVYGAITFLKFSVVSRLTKGDSSLSAWASQQDCCSKRAAQLVLKQHVQIHVRRYSQGQWALSSRVMRQREQRERWKGQTQWQCRKLGRAARP